MGLLLCRPRTSSFDDCALPPELLQHVAQFIPTAADLFRFLYALPLDALTEPVASLLELGGTFFEPDDLWPALALPPHAVVDPEARVLLAKAMVMYPLVRVRHVPQAVSWPLLPTTAVALSSFHMKPDAFDLAVAHWPEQLVSLHVLLLEKAHAQDEEGDATWCHARISSLCDGLRTLRRLRHFHLRHCLRRPAPELWDALCAASALESLTLDADADSVWDTRPLAAWIAARPGLRSLHLLNLSGAITTDDATNELATAIFGAPQLRSLQLVHCAVTRLLLQESRPALPPHLVRLVVHTDDASIDATQLVRGAVTTTPHLRIFSLVGAPTTSPLRAFPSTDRLRHLCLKYIPLSRDACKDLAMLVPCLTLTLDGNDLNDDDVEALAPAFADAIHLRKVYLRHQPFGDKGAMALATSLPISLRVVSLAKNQIGTAGAIVLSDRLHAATTHWATLVLRANPLGKDGVLALVTALAARPFCALDVVHTVVDAAAADVDACKAAIAALPHGTTVDFW
ncbi:hypothetical protein SPRG_14595 [Saprolegnia parasitica CBS 223.65]|uniref:F-box domain-containing protein n=1 Tax=Saprolegnia parasitica (strain CBS 223.65) TaxID=695850 RepID=A0A067BTG7_SAPPC|nr:hypothetical protein SPRG_14595 [Saprolegnia parasitica CBS 223.65]KDO20115.1 hypothetical protein SPRG_14595 [Saprolegnia parasitica CBS 223.65]|eukprot:XP_012209159.1 hypothetical protein SPRG_14595 [Saprolegnia parasitica CBS 223.65]